MTDKHVVKKKQIFLDRLPEDHKERLCLLWALRIAIYLPAALETKNHRSAEDELLSIIGPHVQWPEALMRDFKIQMAAEEAEDDEMDPPVPAMSHVADNPVLITAESADENQWDYSALSRPFNAYYQKRKQKVRRVLMEAEQRVLNSPAGEPDLLARNAGWLAGLIGLNDAETSFLIFALYVREHQTLRNILRSIPISGIRKAASDFATIIGDSTDAIQTTIGHSGKLHRLGFFKGNYGLTDLEDLIPNEPKIYGILNMFHDSLNSLVSQFLDRPDGTDLTGEDYGHLEIYFNDLTAIIRNALIRREPGVNILFYGPPGTGKTQFARLLAKTIGTELFEVRCMDDDQEPASINERLMGLEMGQNFLKNSSENILLFDEVEAVIEGESDSLGSLSRLFGAKGHARNANKAWINHALDNTSVPTIWVANEIDRFDPAFLRRFVYSLEFTIPPTRIRRRAIDRYMANMDLSHEFRDALATQWLSPAQIEVAMRSTRLIDAPGQEQAEKAILRSIKASMKLMGQDLNLDRKVSVPYRLEYLNVDSPIPVEDWANIADDENPLTICLSGPPGSGKSQLAHYLSHQLQKPLLVKRGSDLLSKWVGGTEANLAAMFEEARSEQAILLLDEADSMLRNWELASQAWQVSQVNEILQQMEAFNGIFICTTNRFEDLDPAALRRFTLKARFDALTPQQRWQFFLEMIEGTESAPADVDQFRLRIQRLDGLTPGDFSVAQRQFRLLRKSPEPSHLIDILEQELRAKDCNAQKRAIGFLH